jgi:CRP/FNR family transcriptional regulator, cyclic AMP receptor protein
MKLHRDAKAELIRTIPLFAECSPQEVAEVASVADEIDLREGRVLATESAIGQEFVVMVEGTAEVRRGDELINTLGPGEFVGEIALVTGEPRTASVVATSPVHALVIEGHAFHRLLADAPGIRAKVERAVSDRLGSDADQAGA